MKTKSDLVLDIHDLQFELRLSRSLWMSYQGIGKFSQFNLRIIFDIVTCSWYRSWYKCISRSIFKMVFYEFLEHWPWHFDSTWCSHHSQFFMNFGLILELFWFGRSWTFQYSTRCEKGWTDDHVQRPDTVANSNKRQVDITNNQSRIIFILINKQKITFRVVQFVCI